jgi:hypothetical protein
MIFLYVFQSVPIAKIELGRAFVNRIFGTLWNTIGCGFFSSTPFMHESIIVLTHQKDYDDWREVPHGNSDGTSDDQ